MHLTLKQERFAQEYVLRGIASHAYRLVYDVRPRTPAKTVWESASRALNNHKVAARIAELRSEAARAAGICTVDLLVELWHNRSIALDLGDVASANAASVARAKLLGLL
jgi:phage terminase small subunit